LLPVAAAVAAVVGIGAAAVCGSPGEKNGGFNKEIVVYSQSLGEI
jgi:hypothetical protein